MLRYDLGPSLVFLYLSCMMSSITLHHQAVFWITKIYDELTNRILTSEFSLI